MSDRRVRGGSRREERYRASMRMVPSFASSTGWPSRYPPIVSQLLLAAAVPEPVPTKRSSSRTRRPNP